MTESKEFALELFDTLSRRRQMQVDKINKEELREIWTPLLPRDHGPVGSWGLLCSSLSTMVRDEELL